MTNTWNEADHPRDEEGKFTYKNGGGTSNKNNKNTEENNITSPYFFELGIEKNYNPNNEIRPKVLGDFKEKLDIYTKNLIKDIKNTEISVPTMGTIKAQDLIPNIENYIKDIRTKDEKRADLIYPSMKKQHPLITDIKLLATMFPYFVERFNQELEKKGKMKVSNIEVMNSFEWKIATVNFIEAFRQRDSFLYNFNEVYSAINIHKFLSYMQKDPQRQEVLKQMLNDFINGGELSMVLAQSFGNIPDAAGLLRIQRKDSDMNINYTKKAIKYNNSDELPAMYKDIIKEKLSEQKLSKNSKGLFFDSDSDPAKRIAKSPEVLNLVKAQKDKIKTFLDYNNGESIPLYENKESVVYEEEKNENMYYAYHKADVHNLKYDVFGNISGDFIDTTDFNEGKEEPIIVQKARELQNDGIIEPKFVIIHFVIPRKTVEKEILNGKRN